MSNYRDATYGGQTITLENQYLYLQIHKRLTGWGWGELFMPGPEGKPDKFVAVLEHLGEVDIAGLSHSLRLEASDYNLDKTGKDQRLTFEVQPQEMEAPNRAFNGKPALKGTVTLTLPNDEPMIYYKMVVEPQFVIYLRSLRGVWLRVGADSFGTARHDAIFPGVDWVTNDEWSSGTDWFEHPEALRVTPHPYKVTIPIMAISYDGTGIGLSWTSEFAALSASSRIRYPQPVFATPNFIDRRSHHLLGLMLPSSQWGMKENSLKADPPIKLNKGQELTLDGQIFIVNGTSLDVVIDWVKRHGMPEPASPRYEWRDALERIAQAYNSGFWVDGKGWRSSTQNEPKPYISEFVSYYINKGSDQEIVRGLKEKVAWCRKQKSPEKPYVEMPNEDSEQIRKFSSKQALEIGHELLKIQTPEGDFPFDPEGRHKTSMSKNDLHWAAIWRPLGQPGDSAIGLCAILAAVLILVGQTTGKQKFFNAARKTLEFAMKFNRPEGGDWWETPLHSPNLLAAGNAAIAYYLGYKQFNDERYLEKARHWIRSVIPFTHLWEPKDVPMIYNTKPCFCSSCWFLADWVSSHVQWEILEIFATSAKLGIDWARIDPELDWNRYHRGVTTAVLRWMVDHNDLEWMHRSECSPNVVAEGAWDTAFTDAFDPVNNVYMGGLSIVSGIIAKNILVLLEKGEIT